MEDVLMIRNSEYDMKDYDHINSHNKKLMYQRKFVQVPDRMLVKRTIYPKGNMITNHEHHCAHGDFVLKGTMHTNVGDFGPGDFVWFKEGYKMYHGATDEAVDVLYMTNKPLDMVYYDEPYSHESDDSNSAICLPKNSYDMKDFPHANSKTKKTLYQKFFVEDEETGATIKRIIYPAGCMIPWHTHTCNHGLYVLKGKLVTNVGDFGPGDFVWFKAGTQMYHGAEEEDVDVLFMSDSKVDINYL